MKKEITPEDRAKKRKYIRNRKSWIKREKSGRKYYFDGEFVRTNLTEPEID